MELENKLAALEDMSSSELRVHWQRLTGEIAPRISPKLLRLALAWELQAEAHGGLPRATQQKLDQLGAGKPAPQLPLPAPGWCANGRARPTSSPSARTRSSAGRTASTVH